MKKCTPNCTSWTSYTVYTFSGSKVIAEYDNGAAPTAPSREYVYGGSALLAKIDSSGTKYYHQDHLSNRLVTSSTGATLEQMGHFPFGESWYNSTGDKLLFTTYERDAESGNDYAQARYYVNRLARFSILDPLLGSTSDPQTLNRYTYVRNSPVDNVDPTGMMMCSSSPCMPGAWAGIGEDGGMVPPPDPWQPGITACGINTFCSQNYQSGTLGPFDSPVAQVNCTTGAWCMVGSYNFSQQNSDGTWKVDWDAQWKQELSDALAAFWQQAVKVYMLLHLANPTLTFEQFMALQNTDSDDPNALQPKLQGGNWNFLYDGQAQPSDCAPGVGGTRCGTSPSLHYPSDKPGYIHLDTANPSAWWYSGSIVHGIVDVLLGNTFFANGIPR